MAAADLFRVIARTSVTRAPVGHRARDRRPGVGSGNARADRPASNDPPQAEGHGDTDAQADRGLEGVLDDDHRGPVRA